LGFKPSKQIRSENCDEVDGVWVKVFVGGPFQWIMQ